ncbi:MAG: type II secretion system F family protein [Acidobacteria bacterium]|jgi:tight adherence protein B|nr:type II secretion system F family protein [Acidobacteriota bacterium]
MIELIVIVFLGVASIVILLMAAGGGSSARLSKERIRVLQSVLLQARRNQEDEIDVADLRKTEELSSIPWLNRILLRFEIVPRLRLLLYQANVRWTASLLLLLTGACFLVPLYLIQLITGQFLAALGAGLLLGFLPWVYVFQKRKIRFKKFEADLPEALDLMVSALRVGHSMNSTLSMVSKECADPLAGEFRICFEEQNYGLDFTTTLDNLITRMPLPDLKMVTTAMTIQRETGGNLAEILENTAHVIRERFALQRQVRTHTAQGRLTGWILTFLPLVIAVLMFLIDPKEISILWIVPIGRKLIYAGIVMILIGAVIIRNIVNVEV